MGTGFFNYELSRRVPLSSCVLTIEGERRNYLLGLPSLSFGGRECTSFFWGQKEKGIYANQKKTYGRLGEYPWKPYWRSNATFSSKGMLRRREKGVVVVFS